MRCDEVQAYLAEHLAGRLADRLSGTVQSYIRSHMQTCPDCCVELEDFEEMQSVLRIIPLEACDSAAMRARFDAFMKENRLAAAAGKSRAVAIAILTRVPPLHIVFAMLVIAAVVLVARETDKWIAVRNVPSAIQKTPPRPVVVPAVPGVVTGQVHSVDGALARGVRVAVMPVPDSGAAAAMALIRVEQTNEDGRYRLDKVPPGRYYVLAGSVDIPTYYPGSPNLAEAKEVLVQAGSTAEHIDFPRFVPALVLPEPKPVVIQPVVPAQPRTNTPKVVPESARQVSSSKLLPISVTVRLDTGERLPYKPDMSIMFIGASEGNRMTASPVVGNLFQVLLSPEDSYSISISRIAAGYSVQSINSGSRDLMHGDRLRPDPLSSSIASNVVVTLTKRDN